MAQKNNRNESSAARGKNGASSKNAVKKTPAKKNTASVPEKQKASRKKISTPNGLAAQLLPFILLVAAVFYTVCLFADGVGIVGSWIRSFSFGLFSGAA